MRSLSSSAPRSRTRGRWTSIGPIPVWIDRFGAWPWRTRRRRPSSSTSIGVHRKEGRHLGLDRLGQHLPSPFTQHGEQRVVLDRPSWPRQPNDGILLHGVSFHR